MPEKGDRGVKILSWIAFAVLAAVIGFLYMQLRQSRTLGADVKENLVTVESAMEYTLEKALEQGKLEQADSDELFTVVVLLDARGCPACIVSELAALNAHWEDLKGHTQVYYGGEPAKYLENREILFEYRRIASVKEILGMDLAPINPVSILIAGGQILDVRVSTTTNSYHKEVASAWYAGVISLF